MKKLPFKKFIFLGIFLLVTLFTIFLFFIDEEKSPFKANNPVQKKLFTLEEKFFASLDEELKEIYLKYGELEVPPEKLKILSKEALNKISQFEKENEITITDYDYFFRIQKLRLFVYMNILNDRLKTEAIIDELKNDKSKYSLLNNYIKVFAFGEEQPLELFLVKNKNWLDNLDKNYYKELKSKIFLSSPIGKQFPNYLKGHKSVKGIDLDLEKYRGKFVLIDFWATWCVPCIAELPYLIEAYNIYGDKDFTILSISLDESSDNFFKFLRKWQIKWPQYFDKKGFTGEIIRAYGVRSLPTTFLLDRNGVVIESDLQGVELLNLLKQHIN